MGTNSTLPNPHVAPFTIAAAPIVPASQKTIAIVAVPPTAHPSASFFEQPAVPGALIALLGTVFVIWWNGQFQKQRLKFEERMAGVKANFDEALATKKYEFDIQLANKRRELDQSLADWQRKSTFAEQALAEFYEAKSLFQEIRSPMAYSSENDDRVGRDSESDDLRSARDRYYPVVRRLNAAADFFNSFYAKRYRAAALFGAEADVPYRGIWSALANVRAAAGSLMSPATHQNSSNAAAHIERMEARVWESYGQNDVVMHEVSEAVALAEQLFQPVITRLPE